MVNFGLAREESITICDLAHDAANCPDINFFTVVIAKKQLWRAIPSRCDVVRQFSARLVDLPGKAEVTDLKLVVPMAINEDKVR